MILRIVHLPGIARAIGVVAWLILGALTLLARVSLAAEFAHPSFALPTGPADAWIPHETDREWTSVASSSDGRNLVAGAWEDGLYVSKDFGASWERREENRRWRALACSSDGIRIVAAAGNGRIHLSNDGGSTWLAREAAREWSAVCSSANGKRLAAAVAGGFIYVSTNAGLTWIPRAAIEDWRAVASSADGRTLFAVAHMGNMVVSRDAGETWKPTGSPGAWTALATSSDGSFVAAAESRAFIHVSLDGGTTWNMKDSNPYVFTDSTRLWKALACSANGDFVAGVDGMVRGEGEPSFAYGFVFASSDRGDTWAWLGRHREWSAIASSADGRRLIASARGGQLYTVVRTTSRYTLFATTNSGAVVQPRFATKISTGSAEPLSRPIRFDVKADHPELFLTPPALRSDGTLQFTPGNRPGSTTVTVTARDETGGQSSPPQTFTILIQGTAFKASPWTGDDSTGISGSATLWAWRLGQPAPQQAVIGGVPLRLAVGPPFGSPGQFSLEGWFKDHDYFVGKPIGIEGQGSLILANSFIDGGNPAIIRLHHLIPGRPYTFTALGIGFPFPLGLRCGWSAGGAEVDIDEHLFGFHHGVRVSHEFTPSAEDYEIRVTPRGPERWGFCAIALNSVPARATLESSDRMPLPRGGEFNFGTLPVGLRLGLSFALRNEGVVPLKDLKLTISGANADEFVVATPPKGPVAADGKESLILEIRPKASGPRRATLRIESNDPEPLTLELIGTGLDEDRIAVTELPDQTIDEDHTTGTIPFSLGESGAGRAFAVAGISSDPLLVPPSQIVFEGTGPTRRVTVTPSRDQFGSAIVQLLASDGRQSLRGRFRLTVRPVNDAPRFTLPDGVVTPAGTDWIAPESPRRWQAIASSHDGHRLIAAVNGGRLHTSTTAGATWKEHGVSRSWIAVASSSGGTRFAAAAADGPIVTSSDSGATWIERTTPRAWSGLASSSDGLRLAAVVDGGQIQTSTNGGVSWTARDRTRLWRGIASSSDGLRLAAIVPDAPIQISSDGGATWNSRAMPQAWTGIASSADGSVLAATSWDGPILVSTNAGATWTPRASDRFWRTISCSADGSRLVAGESLGGLHVSTDFGNTWTRRGGDQDWISAAWSGDGEQVAVAAFGGSLFTSATRMAPHRLVFDLHAGPAKIPGFVRGISAGPRDEANQRVQWTLSNADPNLFATAPSIAADGSLTFVPKGQTGLAHLMLVASDDGGTERGGSDTSEPRRFEIELRAP